MSSMSKHATTRKVVPSTLGLWASLHKTAPPPPPPPPPPSTPPSSDTIQKWIDRNREALDAHLLEAKDLKRDIPRQECVRDDLQKRLDGMGARHHLFNTELYQMNNKVLPKLRRLNARRVSLPKERKELVTKIEGLKKDLTVALEREAEERVKKEAVRRAKAAEQPKSAAEDKTAQRHSRSGGKKTNAQAQGKKRKASEMAEKEKASSLEPPKKSRKKLVRVVDSEDEEVLPGKESVTTGASKKRKAPEEDDGSETPARKVAKSSTSPGDNRPHDAEKMAVPSSISSQSTENDSRPSSANKSTGGTQTLNTSSSDTYGKTRSHVTGRNRMAMSGKGITRAVQKASGKNTGSESGKGVKKPAKPVKRRGLNGLINHNQSCFSSVVIQMLHAALEEGLVDRVIGLLDEKVETFGLSGADCTQFDMTAHLGDLDRQQRKQQKALRAAIKDAARAGETEKVSVAKHLRALLASMREEHTGAADKNVSPYLFQSVFAFGATEDADRSSRDLSHRQKLSGDVQQDCFEYYQKVLEVLDNDPHTKDPVALKELFEIGTRTRDVCAQEGCGYKSSWRYSSENFQSVNVPETGSKDPVDFGDLLLSSKTSETDQDCPICASGRLSTKSGYTALPENFVVKLNRTALSAGSYSPSKIETFIDVAPETTYTLNGFDYEVVAVIRHEGRHIDLGHYNILRKFQDQWYLISDKDCSKRPVASVKDHERGGKAAMVMMRKVAE